MSDRKIAAAAERIVVEAESRYRHYFQYDRLRLGLVPDVGTAEQSVQLIQRNVKTLRSWLADDAVAFGVEDSNSVRVVDIETRGRAGVNLLALEQVASNGETRLYRDGNLNGRLDVGDPEVPAIRDGSDLVLDQPLPLLAAWQTVDGGFDPGRMPYRFFVTGATGGATRPRLVGRMTGEAPATENLVPGRVLAAPTAWHPWRLQERPGVYHEFSGDVRVSKTLRIPAGDTVRVAAGTTFRLDPDVSFVSRGVVRFEGTPERPVRLVPTVSGRPWGAFSLVGSGSDGSTIRHSEFVEGGGSLVDRVEYTGMVNVHRVRDVIFDSVLFLRNRRSDDAFHALHADITLTNSRFVDANGDAVDLDLSAGEIRHNIFENSGGDAIDLMTSAPKIVGNRIRNASDKGISVGEASQPIIFANLIEDSFIGIEIKDRSSPIILNNQVRGSRVGLGSHLKNWRYGSSGFGFVANSLFEENRTPLDADHLSRLTAVGVSGLDVTSAATPAPVELPWLYRRLGIEIEEPSLGVPDDWGSAPPIRPIEEFRFVDDFESVADGWVRGPRVTRLEKRHGVLVIEAEGGTGTVSRDVSWDLLAPGGGVLVVELAGRDVEQVRVEAEGSRGNVARSVDVLSDSSRFLVAELLLPADRYGRVTVSIEPTSGLSHIQRTSGLSVARAGRLFLRSVAAYPVERRGGSSGTR